MEFKKIYLTVSVIALTCSQYAVASPLDNISHTHTQHTLELKPISNSFQIAAATFLPDKGEDLGFNGRELNDNHGNTPQIDLCSKFPLSACPANAKCSKCPTGNKFKLSGCNDGFKLSAGTCVALNCPEINPAYRADVPVNQVCSTISASGKTCYQTCKAIDFSGYPVTSCPANATCADHPDCATTSTKKGNCSPIKKKVTTCTLPSQKLNANASGCVNKDDTCPTTYFKTCDTGTTGTAKYTELGSACYQCKPPCDVSIYKFDTANCMSPNKLQGTTCGGKYEKCITQALILYSDRTTSYDVLPNKVAIGIVIDERNRIAAAINLDSDQTYYEAYIKAYGSSPQQVANCQWGANVKEWENSDTAKNMDVSGLENCDCENTSCATDGKLNTKAIIEFGGKNMINYDAAMHAYAYKPRKGCIVGSWCGAGNWFLPSTRDLYSAFKNKQNIRNTISIIDGADQILPDSYKSGYISSNERNGETSCMISMETGVLGYKLKSMMSMFVLPVIKY